MRDDLLDAQAAIDWAVSQMDTLKSRLISWREEPPYTLVPEHDADIGKQIIRIRNLKLPPRIINAEVGAIINSLRSSLDLVVTSVARRARVPRSDKAYFPVAADQTEFFNGGYKGSKVIKSLPQIDQTRLESLQPWRGGNNPWLLALHDLDNMRKHRQLVTVSLEGDLIKVPLGTPERPGFQIRILDATFEENAPIAILPIDIDYREIYLAIYVALVDAGVATRQHVITALNEFARLADTVIKVWDDP